MSPSNPLRPPSRARTRPAYRGARAFYLTLLIGACFATYAILGPHAAPRSTVQSRSLHRRDVFAAADDDEQCRLVHSADDQCLFVHTHCPEDEAGFAAYLDLYYCKLPHVKAVGFIILISWLGLLFSTIGIAASDFFCINLSTIATILGMSESMAGVTFLAFGNGSPDVFSTFAAMSTNSGSLALGELFGAAGFITAVVSGSMALIRPFHVARKSFIRDVGFFVVAAAFSIVFLWDGRLHFWECIAMVLYYFFYVGFVVAWHWWLGRRRRKRDREATMRSHYVAQEEEELEEEEYHDDPDANTMGAGRPTTPRNISREDWSALERGGDGQDDEDEDEEEEARDRWMSDLNSNMRLTLPPARARTNTLTPIRPSLVGALEFQAVLKALQKSRNIQTYPLHQRRFSDDPAYTTAQQQDRMSTVSDPAARPPYQLTVHDDDATPTMERPDPIVPASAPPRNRTVSANDIFGLDIDPEIQRLSRERSRSPETQFDRPDGNETSAGRATLEIPGSLRDMPPSPSVEISPATPRNEAPISRSLASTASVPPSPDLLAPPFDYSSSHPPGDLSGRGSSQDHRVSGVPSVRSLPKIIIPGRERSRSRSNSRASTPRPSSTPRLSAFPRHRDSPASPFPQYHDDPPPSGMSATPALQLPPPASPESLPATENVEQASSKRPSFLDRWWPHSIVPPAGVVISTLFPTIYHWGEKNYWEKALGVVAAPSVFLLTITLPVVESGKDEELSSPNGNSPDSVKGRGNSIPIKNSGAGVVLNDPIIHAQTNDSLSGQGAAGQGTTTANIAANAERQRGSRPSIVIDEAVSPSSPTEDLDQDDLPDLWNRWLLIVQLFLSPLFIVFAVYSQAPIDISADWLLKPTFICLLVSIVLLIPLLLTTTPTHKPAVYRYILSLAGFVVSIAWISTVASQVVGALKALAVILNMSHAIMGLTIFAVGNSLGDLVADVTVARLGYPVMALSACFGGPMLNILLGIGLSGSYILVRGANHRVEKHPDRNFKFKSYHIEVSNTLIVSGVTLLLTLVGLMVAVPLNKWVFSKRIGWTLIAVWVLSTIGNVVVEVTGLADVGVWGIGGR